MNVYAGKTTEVVVAETDETIEAVKFKNSELFQVPSDLFRQFPSLKYVDVEMTKIKKLFFDNFYNAKELKYLLASLNGIQQIGREIFVHSKKLKMIIFQFNQITYIHPNAFDGLTKLETLLLDYNLLTTLEDKMLSSLTSLRKLSISNNKITSIPENLFKNNEKLEFVSFGHNEIAHFGDNNFKTMNYLEFFSVAYNHLKVIDLTSCKSTVIDAESNELESVSLNKWNKKFIGWENPIRKFAIHEHYGSGRSYNMSFAQVNQMQFFVHEKCCAKENLESFEIMKNSFGDLEGKDFKVEQWKCQVLKTIAYQTKNGIVINVDCEKKMALRSNVLESREAFTEASKESITESSKESMEELNKAVEEDFYVGLEIETLENTRKPPSVDPNSEFDANVYEISGTTTESYEQKCERGIFRRMKDSAKSWKDRMVNKWNNWWEG